MSTSKEQRFISEYLVDSNGTQAAIRAGYSAKSAPAIASRLLKKVNVAQAIDATRAHLVDEKIADGTERREFLTAMVRNAAVEPRDRLKACDQLNKLAGEYSEKREVVGNVPAAIAFIIVKAPGADCRP